MAADNGLTENTYEYDANGNRNGGSNDVGDGNRLTTDGVWNYFYDNEGNLIKRVNITEGEDAGIAWTYSYDHANHLVQAKLWDSDPDEHEEAVLQRQADYVYDVFGNRVEKSVDWDGEGEDPAEVSKFAYDGWNNMKPTPVGTENFDIWGELDDNDDLVTRNLRGDAADQLFAQVAANGDTLWNLTDHLGSIRDIIDNTGAVKDLITYDAFGNFLETDSEFGGRYKWTNREFDAETGFQYNRARYYDSETGRWISQDPLGFDAGDSNLYRYVNNRPTINVDPSGQQTEPLARLQDEDIKSERLKGSRIPLGLIEFNNIVGRIDAYKDVEFKYPNDDMVQNAIQLQFEVENAPKDVKRPAGNFHWIQFHQHYMLNAKGQELKEQYSFKAAGRAFTTKKGEMHIDSRFNNVAYYDQMYDDNSYASARRTATELSIFDRPTFYEPDNPGIQKEVLAYDSYLVYDEGKGNGKVLYHVHWERVLMFKNGEAIVPPTYPTIKGNPVSKLPDFAQGDALLWGYDKIEDGKVMGRGYIRNPIPKKNR